jgi:hypothetical protein
MVNAYLAFSLHRVGLDVEHITRVRGWETISMVEKYSKPLTFDDALSIYHSVNGGEV